MKNKVVALSGYPASGKTTVGMKIVNDRDDFVYFDFGSLFRPLTYYLLNVEKFTYKEIETLVNNDKLKDVINIEYRIADKIVEIGINGYFYDFKTLNNPRMDEDTLTVGGIINDGLIQELRNIVISLKASKNVLINARRPLAAYPELDAHVFLTCDFNERAKRKSKLNNMTLEEATKSLEIRDKKEKENGFWDIFQFTSLIDTTNLCIDNVCNLVMKEFNKKYRITYLNNLTLILGSYKCNKNCPYCIAKNNQKFVPNDNLNLLNDVLDELEKNGFNFKRFVLSGNGEPSKYTYEQLKFILFRLESHSELFELLRVHSSGNIFSEPEKLELFNSSKLNTEFEILRVSLDSKVDMEVLGYDIDYLKTPWFKNCKGIKCDIAFTDYLETEDIKNKLEKFISENPSISKIRFKKLMSGDFDNTKQAKWVKEHSLADEKINKVLDDLNLICKDRVYISEDKSTVYKPVGDYDKDLVINDGMIKDYNHQIYSIKKLRKEYCRYEK